VAGSLELPTLVQRIRLDASSYSAGVRTANASLSALSSGIGGTLRLLGTVAGATGAALGAIATGGAILGQRTNAELETAELQFRTLLGSAEAAHQRVQELFKFAAATPFEAGPVIQASRLLQTFGGSVLASEQNLRLIGDASAAASVGIEEVAFWVGRAYAAIQGGQPWGEARLRLQELALVTPQASAQIEEMTKAGASAEEQWAVLEQQLGKFSGAMLLQAKSWKGLTSTAHDFASLNSADVFRGLFDESKKLLGALLDLEGTQAFVQIKAELTGMVNEGVAGVDRLLSGPLARLRDFNPAGMISRLHDVAGSMQGLEPFAASAGAALAAMSLRSVPLIGQLVPVWAPVVGAIAGFVLKTEAGRQALEEIGRAAGEAGAILGPSLVSAMRTLLPPLEQFVGAIGHLAAELLPELADTAASLIPILATGLGGALRIVSPLIEVLADNADLVVDAMLVWGSAMLAIKFTQFLSNITQFTQLLGTGGGGLLGVLRDVPDALRLVGNTAGGAGAASAAGGLAGAAGTITTLFNPAVFALTAGVAAATFAFMAWQKEQREAEARTRAFTQALDEQNTSVIAATRGVIAKSIADNNQQDDLRDIGVTINDVTAAVTGSDDTYRKLQTRVTSFALTHAGLNKELRAQGLTVEDVRQALLQYDAAIERVDLKADVDGHTDIRNALKHESAEYVGLIKSIQDQRLALDGAARQRIDLAVASGQLTDADAKLIEKQNTAKDGSLNYMGALIQLAQATGDAKAKQDLLTESYSKTKNALESTLGVLLGAEALNDRAIAKQQELALALFVSAGATDANTEAGRKNRDLLRDLVQTYTDEQEAKLRNGEITQQAANNNEFLRSKLEELKATFPGLTPIIDAYLTKLNSIPPDKNTDINVHDNASWTVDQLLAKMRELRDTPWVTSVGVTAGYSNPFAIRKANGGILRYADGAHVAQIAPAGAWRVWAEPETGGEAYIPLGGSKRGRSTNILATVAEMFGYSLVQKGRRLPLDLPRFAAGGLANVGTSTSGGTGWSGGAGAPLHIESTFVLQGNTYGVDALERRVNDMLDKRDRHLAIALRRGRS
jgi:hypothetical protein